MHSHSLVAYEPFIEDLLKNIMFYVYFSFMVK